MSYFSTIQLIDNYGFSAQNTPVGAIKTIDPCKMIGSSFPSTSIDSTFWTSTVSNSATITSSGGQGILSSGTNSAGSAQLYTTQRAIFVPGGAAQFKGEIQLGDIGIANNVRRWGVSWGATMPTITDGAWFQLSGTTFQIVTSKGGSPTTVSNGSFNGGFGSTFTLTTNNISYEIYYSSSSVIFIINGVVLHRVTTAPWSVSLSFCIYLSNINTGNTTDSTLKCIEAIIYRLGKLQNNTSWINIVGVNAGVQVKGGPGRLHSVVLNGGTSSTTVSLYNGTSAVNPIAVISPSGAGYPVTISYDAIEFQSGLFVVTTIDSTNITIIFE